MKPLPDLDMLEYEGPTSLRNVGGCWDRLAVPNPGRTIFSLSNRAVRSIPAENYKKILTNTSKMRICCL